MTFKPQVPCSGRDCPNLVDAGARWCDECKKEAWCKESKAAKEERPKEYEFYHSKIWREAREAHLKKDPFCTHCGAQGKKTFGEMVDHIVPLRLAWDRRTDPSNLATLCNRCHAQKRGREMRMKLYSRPASAADITIVCGPPGSGKTTYVRENFVRGDLIIDLDAIMSALSNLPWYDKPANLIAYANEVKTALINKAMIDGDQAPRIWIIATAAHVEDRARLRSRLGAITVVLETTISECVNRIAADPRRPHQAAAMEDVIKEWWEQYRPDDLDIVIKDD
jgi:5-methylcytosine-specific restriction endonuclease McrA/predicted kinase